MALVQSSRVPNGRSYGSWDAIEQLCEKAFAPKLITSPLPSTATFDDIYTTRPANPTPSSKPIPVPAPRPSSAAYPVFKPMGRCGPGQYVDDSDSPLFSSPDSVKKDAAFEKMWNDAAKMVNRSTTTSASMTNAQRIRRKKSRFDMRESTDSDTTTVTIDMPGVMKEDVHINFQADRLLVSWEYVRITEKHEDNKIVRERKEKKYIRTINLPQGTQFEQVKASMDERRLTIKYPKPQPTQSVTIQCTSP